MKAQNGEPRNTVFPIFGYTYNDAFERIPDAETAPIVQLIYKKLLEFGSTGRVAKYLTEQKIKTPRYYNAIKYKYNKAKVLSLPEEKLHKGIRRKNVDPVARRSEVDKTDRR